MIRTFKRLFEYGRMIKFSHSLFAMPFALSGAALANRYVPITWNTLLWIVLAILGANYAAMGFNRLVEREIDPVRHRTSERHFPGRSIGKTGTAVFVMGFSAFFIFAAVKLNTLCLSLSPVALAVVLLYSYTKRFTSLSHFVLGLALGLSPVGAWIAVAGYFSLTPVMLGAAVLFWVAGFDILYACQDHDFDTAHGLFSIPQKYGIKNALRLSRLSHIISFLFLMILHSIAQLHFIYTAGLVVIAGLLVYEHSLVKADELSKLDFAFFRMNGVSSIVFSLAVLGDVFLL